MTATTASNFSLSRTHLLREDVELGRAIAPRDRPWAIEHCVAPVMSVARGTWEADDVRLGDAGIGLLVLDGMLLRRVGVDGRFGAELLGEGDLLRPSHGDDLPSSLSHTSGWKALTRTRLAVLDATVAQRLSRYPTLTGELVARALNRVRCLALMMAIVHQPRIEMRLHMMLWHLADRWGRVRRDGVILPLRLSHSVLADLIAAQRPSVTGALRKLSDRQLVLLVEDGWLLCGGPPGELLEIQEVEVPKETGVSEADADGPGICSPEQSMNGDGPGATT